MLHSRRTFLKLTGRASLGLGAAALLHPPFLYAATAAGSAREGLIAAIGRDIFPHERVSSSLYIEIAQRIIREAADSPETDAVVKDGIEWVRQHIASRDWSQLDEAKRIDILEELEGGPFFNLVRSTAVQVLYRHPEVWELIGYGGSAIEQGGYLDSFNNIDWLPNHHDE